MEADDKTRVLAINGSARAPEGNTDMVVRRFLKGAADAGAETDIIYPARMNIAHCEADIDCWVKTGGRCRHDDDMPQIALKYVVADIVVFAGPVYVDGMTSHMKKMFERFLCYSPPFVEYVGRRSYHPKTEADFKEHKIVTISTCGFPEREHFEAMSLHYKRLCANMHVPLIAEFYFPGFLVLETDPAAAADQLDAVERAGREAVTTGAIPESTVEAANREYITDYAGYDERLNEYYHDLRREHGME
jgi:multimeric flavodoxin WrbA